MMQKGTVSNGVLNIETSLAAGKNISAIKVFTWDNITDIKPVLPTVKKSIPKS